MLSMTTMGEPVIVSIRALSALMIHFTAWIVAYTLAAQPVRADDRKETSNSIGMKLVLIPAGEFQMGSPDAERMPRLPERPQHLGRITKAFYVGKYEVTRGEFRKFVEAAGYKTEAENDGKGGFGYTGTGDYPFAHKPKFTWREPGFAQTDEHPVVLVSWNDAVEFCKWLSRKEGKTYRLPTEAEWEYACRADTTTRWSGGDIASSLQRRANVADAAFEATISLSHNQSWNDGYAFTAPVGKFDESKFGLHDMHGNVWEWCSDCSDEYNSKTYYSISPVDDPPGPDKPQDTEEGLGRVFRGGSWYDGPTLCRSACRYADAPTHRHAILGFRVVRVR